MSREQLREIRSSLKKQIKASVSPATLARLARPFLGNRKCSFSYQKLLAFVRSE